MPSRHSACQCWMPLATGHPDSCSFTRKFSESSELYRRAGVAEADLSSLKYARFFFLNMPAFSTSECGQDSSYPQYYLFIPHCTQGQMIKHAAEDFTVSMHFQEFRESAFSTAQGVQKEYHPRAKTSQPESAAPKGLVQHHATGASTLLGPAPLSPIRSILLSPFLPSIPSPPLHS